MPGASSVAPGASPRQPDAIREHVRHEPTVHHADLRSDIVVIGVQLRDLEVLVVVGRIQQVRGA